MSKKSTTEEFIEKARKIHGNKYDYSKVEYKSCKDKVCIVCKKHGEFWQTPSGHLSGKGCIKCGFETTIYKQRFTKEEFIKKAKSIHGDKYDYSKVDYVNSQNSCMYYMPRAWKFYD